LGEIPEASLATLADCLRPVAAQHLGFDLVVEGVGAFPTADRPRVVWRGVGVGEAPLRGLATAVREAVCRAGFPDDPIPFSPHVTLFRVRSTADRARAFSLLNGTEPAPRPIVVSVREVHLVESRLVPAGAIHQVRARFPLAPPVG